MATPFSSHRSGRDDKPSSHGSASRSRTVTDWSSASSSRAFASRNSSSSKSKTFAQKRKKANLRANNPDQTTTRRHRFETFTNRLAKINVDPLRLARSEFLRAEDEAEETSSYFRAALDKWKVTNLSKNFSEFVSKVNGCSETLPQIVYHEQKIFESLMCHVEKGDVLSLEPLLSLTSNLAHDLGVRFGPFVDRTVSVLSGLVLKHTDVEVIEWSFSCLVWLFKYLSRMLVQRLPDVYDLVTPLLGSVHKKEFVAHFAAEALAFLLRKATSRFGSDPDPLKSMLTRCVESMFTHASSSGAVLQDGLVVLLTESIRGIKQSVHSHGPLILTEFVTTALRIAATKQSADPVADFFATFLTRAASDFTSEAYEQIALTFLTIVEKEAELIKSSPVAARIVAESLFALVQKVRSTVSDTWSRVLKSISAPLTIVSAHADPHSLRSDDREVDADISMSDLPSNTTAGHSSLTTSLSALAVCLCRCPILVALSSSARTTLASLISCSTTRPSFLTFALFFLERCLDERAKDVLLPYVQKYISMPSSWETEEAELQLCDFVLRVNCQRGEYYQRRKLGFGAGKHIFIPQGWQDKMLARLTSLVSECGEGVNHDVLALNNAYLEFMLTLHIHLPVDPFKSVILQLVERGFGTDDAILAGPSGTGYTIPVDLLLFTGNAFKVAVEHDFLTASGDLVSRLCGLSSRLAGSMAFLEGLHGLLGKQAPPISDSDWEDIERDHYTVATTIVSNNPTALRALVAGICVAVSSPSSSIRFQALELAKLLRRNKPKGEFRDCDYSDVMEILMMVEAGDVKVQNIRHIAMDLERIGAGYNKLQGLDKVPEASANTGATGNYLDNIPSGEELTGPNADDAVLRVLVPAFCFGMLSSEIAQTCDDAATTLQTISEGSKFGEKMVAEMAFAWIRDYQVLDESGKFISVNTLSPPALAFGDTYRRIAAQPPRGEGDEKIRRYPAELREVLFSATSDDNMEELKGFFDDSHITAPFRIGRREQALKVLTKVPKSAERRAREIVGVIIGWGEAEGELDDEDEHVSNGSTAKNAFHTPSSSGAYDSRSWSMNDKKLLLALFSHFSNPRSLYRSAAVYSALLSLLSSGDLEIQRSALRAIFTWKDPSVLAHTTTLLGLLDEAQFRERVALLVGADGAVAAASAATAGGIAGMSSVEGVLLPQDRPAVMRLAIRVLYGRAISRAGRGGQQGRRRRAVLGAMARCENEEIGEFVKLALGKLGKMKLVLEAGETGADGDVSMGSATSDSHSAIVEAKFLDGRPVVGERKQNGLLGLVKDLVSVFGGTLPESVAVKVAEAVMYITLHKVASEGVSKDEAEAESVARVDEDVEDDVDVDSDELDGDILTGSSVRRIRSRALRLLASLFRHYPSLSVWPVFLPLFFDRVVSPRLGRLATESSSATAAASGLYRIFAEWANSSEMAGWLTEYDGSVMKCLAGVVENKAVHGNVKKIVLQDVISGLVRVAEGKTKSQLNKAGSDEDGVVAVGDDGGKSTAAAILTAHAGLYLHAVASLLSSRPELGLTEAAVNVVVQLSPYADAGCDGSTLVALAAAIARERDVKDVQAAAVVEAEKIDDNAEDKEDEDEGDEDEADGDEVESDDAASPDQVAIHRSAEKSESSTPQTDHLQKPSSEQTSSTPARPSTAKPKARIPFRLRITCLQILRQYIPSASLTTDSPLTALLISDLAALFADLDGVTNRALLCDILSALAVSTTDSSLVLAAELAKGLNAYARMGQPNFDLRLEALRKLAEDKGVIHELGPRGWKILLGTCLFTIRTTDDMALRTASTLAVRRFVKLAKDSNSSSEADSFSAEYISIIERMLIPAIRRGVRHRDEVIRLEFVVLLSSIVSSFPTKGTSVSCLSSLLMGGDVEANFFENILHIQPHRRVRAIKRLGEHSQTHEFSSGVTVGILIPLLDAFVPQDERNDGAAAVNTQDKKLSATAVEALSTISVLVQRLSWSALRSGIEKQRKGLKESVPGKFFIKRLKAWLDGFSGWLDVHSKKAEPETEGLSTADGPGISYIRTLCKPMSDFFHRQSDDTVDARLALLGSLARLLKFLPETECGTRMTTLLTDVASILRSRSVDVRDQCRSAINEVLAITGPEGVQVLIGALKTALQRGYQRHVLGFTLHSALVSLTPRLVPGDLDVCADEISTLCIEDVLGAVGEEKDAPDYVGKMKEVKAQKGFDAMELLSRVLSPSAVSLVLRPLRDMLVADVGVAPRVSRRLDELLRRIGMGLGVNETLQSEAGMVLCHELITASVAKTLVPKHIASAVKVSATATNSPKIMIFGLDLLRSLLRRTAELRSAHLLIGLMPGVCDAAISTNADVQAAAMRLITSILGINTDPMPALDAACPVLVAEAVRIVEASPTTTADTAQAGIKLVGAILRHRQDVPVKQVHLAYLLRRIKPDLAEPDRHGLPFSLLRAVIARKIVMPELYDVMDSVASIMVTNHTRTLRDAAAAAYLHFLTDCPQTRDRFNLQIAFFVANLEYKHQEGRQTIMEALHLILTKFSDELVEGEVIERVFVPLVLVMVNDDSDKCRAMAGLLMKDVFARAGTKTGSVVGLLERWTGGSQNGDAVVDDEDGAAANPQNQALLLAALKLWVILLETREDLHEVWIPFLIRRSTAFLTSLTRPLGDQNTQGKKRNGTSSSSTYVSPFDSDSEDHADVAERWDTAFHTLLLVEKLCEVVPELMAQQGDIWKAVVLAQKFPHQWVKAAGMKIISNVLLAPLAGDNCGQTDDDGDAAMGDGDSDRASPFAAVLSSDDLQEITRLSLRAMSTSEVSEEVLQRACRNVFLLGRHYAKLAEVEGEQDDNVASVEGAADDSDSEDDSDEEEKATNASQQTTKSQTSDLVGDATPKDMLSHIFDRLSRMIRSEDASRTVAGLQTKQAALLLSKSLIEVSTVNSASTSAAAESGDGAATANSTVADLEFSANSKGVSVLATIAAQKLLRALWTLTNTGASEQESHMKGKSSQGHHGSGSQPATNAVTTLASARASALSLATDTLSSLQTALGTATYIDMLQEAKTAALKTREERRVKRKVDQVRNPERAEKEKRKKREVAKRRKVEKSGEWRSQRRGW